MFQLLDEFMTRKAEPSGEHPDAKKITPMFGDWDENSWWLRPFSWPRITKKKVP